MVTRDIPDYALAYGNPAQLHGWVCQCGDKLDFSQGVKAQCIRCGKIYEQKGEEEIEVMKDDSLINGK